MHGLPPRPVERAVLSQEDRDKLLDLCNEAETVICRLTRMLADEDHSFAHSAAIVQQRVQDMQDILRRKT